MYHNSSPTRIDARFGTANVRYVPCKATYSY